MLHSFGQFRQFGPVQTKTKSAKNQIRTTEFHPNYLGNLPKQLNRSRFILQIFMQQDSENIQLFMQQKM